MNDIGLELGRRFQRAAQGLGIPKLAAVAALDEDAEEAAGDTTLVPTPEEDELVVAQPAPPPVITAKNLFQHPHTHPVVLDLMLLQKYEHEWLLWEVETLSLRIPVDFHGQQLSETNLHKIQAMKTLHLVDGYWNQWEVFLFCTMALNAVTPDFRIMQVPTVAQCMVSVDIANRVREESFSDEVKRYLEVVHRHDGVLVPIEPLEFVQIDTEGYPVDVKEISTLWSAVRASGKPPSADTVTAEQLRRMLALRQHLEDSRTALRGQLPLVTNA